MNAEVKLSNREFEILEQVATGASNREIADSLVISPNTVKVHLKNIYGKLGVNTRTEAALYAIKNNIFNSQTLSSESLQPDMHEDDRRIGRSNAWNLSLGLAGILLLGLVGMFILLRDGDKELVLDQEQLGELVRWQKLSDLPTPRSDLAIASYDNQLYVIGGMGKHGVSGAIHRYDPENNNWIRLPDKPLPVSDVRATAIGGLIYIPGGQTASGELTNVVEVYRPLDQVWFRVSNLPIALSRYSMVAYEGQLYIFGGWNGDLYTNLVFSYNPQTNSWIERTSMPSARGYSGAAVTGSGIHIIGGTTAEGPLAVHELYIPNHDDGNNNQVWESRQSIPSPRFAAGVTSIADIIYVVGGDGGGNLSEIIQYMPQEDKWISTGDELGTSWSHLGLSALGTSLYAVGGIRDGSIANDMIRMQAIFVINIPLVQ